MLGVNPAKLPVIVKFPPMDISFIPESELLASMSIFDCVIVFVADILGILFVLLIVPAITVDNVEFKFDADVAVNRFDLTQEVMGVETYIPAELYGIKSATDAIEFKLFNIDDCA
jgi:hypothetical protein